MENELNFGSVWATPYEQDGELWVQLAQEQSSDPYYDTYVKVSDLEQLLNELRKESS